MKMPAVLILMDTMTLTCNKQDYDEDRYEKDSDYAEGVDDAMDDAYYQYGEEY